MHYACALDSDNYNSKTINPKKIKLLIEITKKFYFSKFGREVEFNP